MSQRLLLLALCLALLPAPARAYPGINLSWSDCGASGGFQRNFACDTNVGVHTLVASFVPPSGLDQLVGMAGVIDLCSMDLVLPGWWQAGSAVSCRPNAVAADFNFTTSSQSCADYWQGRAVGGVSYTYGQSWGFNGARIRAAAAIPSSAIAPTDDQTEYYAFKITIRNDATVGAGACDRCASHVCIILNSLELYQPLGVGNHFLTQPIMSNYVQWQGEVLGCPFVVPVARRSWGQIKSLYR